MNGFEILQTLCRIPTVSYYERGIASAIWQICERNGIQVSRDRWGNLFAMNGNASPADARVAFVAHMDHPGFEVVDRNDDGSYRAVSHGGMAAAAFVPGTPIEVVSSDGTRTWGNVLAADEIQERGRFASCSSVKVETEKPLDDLPAMAVLGLFDFVLDGGTIRARALDDLAGCATILAALIETRGADWPSVGILTRAEEVGLVGARLIAWDRVLDPTCVVVSVETSLKSETARQGDGVVIRVGDRMTTFNDDAEALLNAHAKFAQRALMGAGGCEASAFAAHGYRVTGTSLPLGAWHNREDDGSLSMEYVSVADFVSGMDLVTSIMRSDHGELPRASSLSLSETPEQEAERLDIEGQDWP